ncbi:hypothetical protein BC939DRAFT_111632 [Gamsiella multidivaricata]|uniref:uncharacterized protein n=1 Tax=Gamsiella multidivaricata TaxID=101098 RepID=UPI00221FFB50|nr:uncharacterized protein BC939DRAFT_111632 [Gamsiella multidivaricata]KAI7826512.1 hypothetical protein BC939DRAFT_111632 [Gamsiella multidivaricata]
MSSQHSPPQGQGDASIPLRSTAMPLNVAHNLPTKSSELSPSADIRRPKRQLPDGRKTRQQRDNIENAPSAAASIQILTSLPVQKQSTKIRKRLTETQPSPYNSDVEPSKRRKVLQTYTAPATVPSALNVTPLHRTLSDKSTYLNQGSVPETNAGLKQSSVKTQSTLASWRMDPRSMHSGSESDDADDEDEISNGNTVRSVVEIQAPSQAFATTDRRQGLISAFGAQPSPAETVSSPSIEDDLFGSDTTLTSPEEDSEDEQETNDASSAQPLEASPLTTPAEEDPSEAMPTPTASPAKRRGPGRPRKNPLPPNTSSSKRRKSQEDIRVSTAEASVLTPPPEQPLSVQPGKYGRSIVSPPPSPRAGKEFTTPKAYGSLMARIIDGKKLLQLEDSEADLSDSSDDTEVVTLVKCKETLSSTHDESLSDTSSRLASPDRIVAPVSDSALGNDTPAAIATSIERAVESVMSKLALIKAESSTKSADHVFAVPAVPLSRPTHATRSSTKAKPVPIKHSGRAFSLTPARRSILKQRHIRPTIRSIPRPRLFQTCLEIMTHPNPTRPRPNVHAMASMLKHFLQRGMCDIQEPKQKVKLLVQDAPLDLASLQAQAWGAVIGNGKGLLQTSTRKQDEQRRVTERRTIVADAYQALNLPPPVENWDKSSKIIAAGLSLDNGPSSTVEGADAQRWSDVRDDTLDHLSRRLGCDYCRKTHSNMNSLLEHMDRCTMAHLVSVISLNEPFCTVIT